MHCPKIRLIISGQTYTAESVLPFFFDDKVGRCGPQLMIDLVA